MAEISHAQQPPESSDRDELVTDLASLRVLTALTRYAPDELARMLRALPAEQARQARAALDQFPALCAPVEPLIAYEHLSHGQRETQRSPLPPEPAAIRRDRILVLAKRTKIEIDVRELGYREDQLASEYAREGTSGQRILFKHQAYHEAWNELQSLVGPKNWHYLWDLSDDERTRLLSSRDFDAVIAFGGDDTLKAIGPYITDQFIALFNSDGHGSVAAMQIASQDQYRSTIEAFERGTFVVEEWPRLVARIEIPGVNGERRTIETLPAMNEIAFHDKNGDYPLRGTAQIVSLYGDRENADQGVVPLKGTGFLVSTPAGAGGWYTSATPHLFPLGRQMPRTVRRAEAIQRERYRFGENTMESHLDAADTKHLSPGVLTDDCALILTSSSNHSPKLTIDGVAHYPFPRGASAVIRLAERGIKVIRPI